MNIWEVVPALTVLFAGTSLYIWVCVKFPPAILLGVVAYSMISKSASVAYLETVEVYLIEVDKVSQGVGAAPRHVLYNLLIFAIALGIVRWAIGSPRPAIAKRMATLATSKYSGELRRALMISATLLGVQILNVILSPPYALPGFGVGRNQFWAGVRFPQLADILGVLVIFVPAIAGVALAYGKVTKQHYFSRFSVMLMLAYGIFFLLSGARFNGSLMALLFWLGSYWTVLWAFGRKLYVKRLGPLVTLAVGVFLVVGYFDIADRGITQIMGSAWGGLLYRAFALQGEIYFTADVLASEGERHSGDLLVGNMSATLQAYMPHGLAEAYLHKGVNLAGSMPGNSILVLGYWLGLAPMVAYAILLGLTVSLYIYVIVTGHFILVLPGAYLCLWAYAGYTQGSFSLLLDYKFSLFVALMIIWLLVSHTAEQRRPTIRARPAKSTIASS